MVRFPPIPFDLLLTDTPPHHTDIIGCGAVLTIGCGFLALAAFISSVLILFRHTTHARTRVRQASILGFLTLWVLITAIATLILTRTKSAKVSAMLGSTKLPEALVRAAEKAAGVHRVYWENWYCESLRFINFWLLGCWFIRA